MKTSHILIAVGVVGAGVYLYRRGRTTADAVGQSPDMLTTLRAGIGSVVAQATASAPSPSSGSPVDAISPSFAGSDPRVTQRTPTRSRTRLNSILAAGTPITARDFTAIGLGN